MRISDWSSDVCSSDLFELLLVGAQGRTVEIAGVFQRFDAVARGLELKPGTPHFLLRFQHRTVAPVLAFGQAEERLLARRPVDAAPKVVPPHPPAPEARRVGKVVVRTVRSRGRPSI